MSLRFVTANMDFGLGHDAEYLAHLCVDADVVLVQEAKNVRLATALPGGWAALQDSTSPATMGSAICYRLATVEARHFRLRLGTLPRLGSRRVKMLARYIATAHLIERKTGNWHFGVSCHFAPDRYAFLQPVMAARLKAIALRHRFAVIGTDANQPLDRLAKFLGLQGFGSGIVGLIFGKGLTVTERHIDRWGKQHNATDHPSVSAVVTHRKARR